MMTLREGEGGKELLKGLKGSLEAAWADAEAWWQHQGEGQSGPVPIGVEVSTASGGWRTLRHPGH